MCGVEEILKSKLLFVNEYFTNDQQLSIILEDNVQEKLIELHKTATKLRIKSDWNPIEKCYDIVIKPSDNSDNMKLQVKPIDLDKIFKPAVKMPIEFCEAIIGLFEEKHIDFNNSYNHEYLKYHLSEFVRKLTKIGKPSDMELGLLGGKFMSDLSIKDVINKAYIIPTLSKMDDSQRNEAKRNSNIEIGKFIYNYILNNGV